VATDVAEKILSEFHPEEVTVEVKKFSVPEARYVSVMLTKERPLPDHNKLPLWLWRRW
jgi:dihydroneopterin aldolase